MEYLLFLVLPLLSVIKVILQSYIVRKKTTTFSDNLFLNFLIFVFAFASFALINCMKLGDFFLHFDYRLLLFALGYAVASIGFQTFYCASFRCGPVGITSLIVSFNIVIQIIFGLSLFGDKLQIYNYVGFVPLLVSMFLLPKPNGTDEKKKINAKWFVLTLLAMLFCGIISVISKCYTTYCDSTYSSVYITFGYLFAAILSLPFIFIFKHKDEHLFKLDWRALIMIAVCGLSLASYNFLLSYSFNFFNLSVVTSVTSALGTVFSIISALLIYKEKPITRQWIGVGIAIIAVVLLSLNI